MITLKVLLNINAVLWKKLGILIFHSSLSIGWWWNERKCNQIGYPVFKMLSSYVFAGIEFQIPMPKKPLLEFKILYDS